MQGHAQKKKKRQNKTNLIFLSPNTSHGVHSLAKKTSNRRKLYTVIVVLAALTLYFF